MKRFATLFVALGLATAGSTVLAEEAKDQVSEQNAKPQPMQMTEPSTTMWLQMTDAHWITSQQVMLR